MPSGASAAIAGGARLLVVGNDDGGRWRSLCAGSEIEPLTVRDLAAALQAAGTGKMDIALVSFDLAATPALDVLQALRGRVPDMPVLLLASPGAISAEQAHAAGAQELLSANVSAPAFLHAIRSALAVGYATDDPPAVPGPGMRGVRGGPAIPGPTLLGDSPHMARVRELIGRAAPGMATILIRGETGTGKELVAKAVHAASSRAAGPLVALHCGALPDNLLESELFGYEKGAFTGADQRKPGRVELAEGGTLFLDEIGDVTPAMQVKLLRLLQDREYQRLGGTETRRADVRFIAATHRDLDAMVKANEFREDLFYRLQVVPLWVPPLRARKGDIALLAHHFCDVFARTNLRVGTSLSDAALERIVSERWPGNVRQLSNFIERLVVLRGGGVIGADAVKEELSGASPFRTAGDQSSRSISSVDAESPRPVVRLDDAVRKAERDALLAALRAAGGNRSQAARLLGVSRATFYNKLKEHGLP